MEPNDRENEIIKQTGAIELRPVDRIDDKNLRMYKKIPLTEISGLGAAFAEMIPKFRSVTETSVIQVDGLWRCSFPEGVSGELAKFRDGSGYLGTIMNNGIVGQARWNPVDSVSTTRVLTAPISPLNVFMAAAMIEMNRKLNQIQKTGEEILSYQKEKDRAEQEANFEELEDIYNKFKYNVQNEEWKRLKYIDVQSIRRQTSAQMKLLQTQINKSMDRHDPIHNSQQTSQMVQKVQSDFQLYRLAVFLYSFATFLEILLQGNFSKEFLESVRADINERSIRYREFYTECYSKLEHSSKTTVKSKLLKGLAKASGDAGRAIHKIPIIEKGPLDEALVSAEKSVSYYDRQQTEKGLQSFRDNMRSGAGQFADGIEQLSKLYNSPLEVLVDKNNMYLKTDRG